MSQQITRVRPGDLITADLMNNVLDQLGLLQGRVSALEGGDAVVITGLLPSGPVNLGSELRIIGRNFGLPGSNVVTIDNTQVTEFKAGSSDTQLIFDIPLLQGIPAQGKLVTLTVSNNIGFASTSMTVVPAQATVPAGTLFVNLSQSPSGALTAGQSFTFGFTVKAITNMDENYTLTPTVQAGWPVKIVDQNNVDVVPAELRLAKGDPPDGTTATVFVRVTIPAGTPQGTATQLKLAVASKRNPSDLAAVSSGDTLTVGSAAPPPQEISVTFSNVLTPSGAQQGTESGGVVTLPTVNAQYRVDFIALIKDPGTYNIALTNPGANWVVRISGSPTGTPLASSITTSASNTNNSIKVLVTPQAGAAQTSLVVRVTKSDDATVFGQGTVQIRIS